MDTRRRDGAAVGANDDAVLLAIKEAIEPDPEGKDMKFAVRNEAGVIYRSIRTTGPRELLRFTAAMEAAGFVDELRDVMTMREGFDGIFRRP